MATIGELCAICAVLHVGSSPSIQCISTPAPPIPTSESSDNTPAIKIEPLGNFPARAEPCEPAHLDNGNRKALSRQRLGVCTPRQNAGGTGPPENSTWLAISFTVGSGFERPAKISTGRLASMLRTGVKSGTDQTLTLQSSTPTE
eukprot:CAMPEP_0194511564 /NCGR_PEP_ID=MMETSP0253-20130528/43280_1 /TAXON_ID=2966 /ORGANISM="Noctiluca scintillans" /LENGTH=144 /DNA_ID=CAMNT_0039354903 /DNA_START=329 /DNA_END=763 /DNA_ORIENTATION=+